MEDVDHDLSELFDRRTTLDEPIYEFLETIKNKSIGYKNFIILKLNNRLEYYGKADIKRMLKSLQQKRNIGIKKERKEN